MFLMSIGKLFNRRCGSYWATHVPSPVVGLCAYRVSQIAGLFCSAASPSSCPRVSCSSRPTQFIFLSPPLGRLTIQVESQSLFHHGCHLFVCRPRRAMSPLSPSRPMFSETHLSPAHLSVTWYVGVASLINGAGTVATLGW